MQSLRSTWRTGKLGRPLLDLPPPEDQRLARIRGIKSVEGMAGNGSAVSWSTDPWQKTEWH